MPRVKRQGLTPKEERFVCEYATCLNATEAAIKAGYSAKTAKVQGSRLLTKVDVRAAIDRAAQARAQRVELKGDEVLAEVRRVALSDVRKAFDAQGRLLPVHSIPEELARCISSIEVEELFEGKGNERRLVGYVRKVKFWPKVEGLSLLMKHLGLLVEKVDVTHHVSLEQLIAEGGEKAS